jgi:hypothetical protein
VAKSRSLGTKGWKIQFCCIRAAGRQRRFGADSAQPGIVLKIVCAGAQPIATRVTLGFFALRLIFCRAVHIDGENVARVSPQAVKNALQKEMSS